VDELRRWLVGGWDAYGAYAVPLGLASLAVSLFAWLFFVLSHVLHNPLVNAVGVFLVVLVLAVGRGWMSLKAVRRERVRAFDVFWPLLGLRRYVAAVCVNAAILLGTVVGALLFVVPGVWWFLRYFLAAFALVDVDFRPAKALKLSGRVSKGYALRLSLLWALTIFLSLLGRPFHKGAAALITHNIGADTIQHLAYGVVPYLVLVLVIVPWLVCSFAAAWDETARALDDS